MSPSLFHAVRMVRVKEREMAPHPRAVLYERGVLVLRVVCEREREGLFTLFTAAVYKKNEISDGWLVCSFIFFSFFETKKTPTIQ